MQTRRGGFPEVPPSCRLGSDFLDAAAPLHITVILDPLRLQPTLREAC